MEKASFVRFSSLKRLSAQSINHASLGGISKANDSTSYNQMKRHYVDPRTFNNNNKSDQSANQRASLDERDRKRGDVELGTGLQNGPHRTKLVNEAIRREEEGI
jgi:hypothetical protein